MQGGEVEEHEEEDEEDNKEDKLIQVHMYENQKIQKIIIEYETKKDEENEQYKDEIDINEIFDINLFK